MGKRRSPIVRIAGVVVVTALAAVLLTGCQAAKSAYGYEDARAAAHSATTVALAGTPAQRKVLADARIACPSDSGFFSTSFTWRTITRVTTSGASTDSAVSAATVASTLHSLGWKSSATRNGITTLTPPAEHASPKQVARILIDEEPGAVVLTVFSACYAG